MNILLLASPKLVTQTPWTDWIRALSGARVTLFIDAGFRTPAASEGTPFAVVETFPNMAANDLVEKRALELHRARPFDRIVALSEVDLLRAARLRERLGLPGQSVRSASVFRDKFEMKTVALAAGVPVAPFARVRDAMELLDFVAKVGYPIVVKPLAGRGSADTFVIPDEAELERRLAAGLFGATNRLPDLLAEAFVPGEMHHVDGLFLGSRLVVINASRYVNDCLSFVNGSVLGSHMLGADNPLKARLEDFVADLLTRVFPTPSDSLFHVEVFVTPDGRLVLCEAACRLGGNAINDELRIGYGIDVKMEYLRSQCAVNAVEAAVRLPTGRVAARLLVPPEAATLRAIPLEAPFDWLESYRITGVVGKTYRKMSMSNDEIASFLFSAGSETQARERIDELARWFAAETRWSVQAA